MQFTELSAVPAFYLGFWDWIYTEKKSSEEKPEFRKLLIVAERSSWWEF